MNLISISLCGSVGVASHYHLIMRFGGRDISVSSHYVVGWAWHLISIIIWLGGRGISLSCHYMVG